MSEPTAQPCRFVLSGFQRSGSNLLLTCLEQNPHLAVYHEVFCGRPQGRPAIAGRVYQDGEPGDRFLEFLFNRPQPPGVQAVGFKWFGDQARDDAAALSAWRWFREHDDIRLVYLDREDWLGMIVSRLLAEQAEIWHIEDQALPRDDTVRRWEAIETVCLAPEECTARLREIAAAREMVWEDAIGHPRLTVTYAELCRDLQGAVDRVTDFLEVPRVPVQASLQKMNRRSPAERLENFKELQDYFARTPYAQFFSPASEGAGESWHGGNGL